MNRLIFPLVVSGCLIALAGVKTNEMLHARNPDPNHTHADFAVWLDGAQLDFAQAKYMSGSATDAQDPAHEAHDKYFHLHDGNGHVVHRHKPGLTIGAFFATLPDTGSGYVANTFSWKGKSLNVRLFVNGVENPQGGSYVFHDDDHLLITDATNPAEVQRELGTMTNDACLYSKTCPWRGSPPVENCIADPEVPCRL